MPGASIQMMINEISLNLNKPSVCITHPFPIFEFEEFFPQELYRELEAVFPDKSLLPSQYGDRGGKFYLGNQMPEFAGVIEAMPIWGKLYHCFSAPSMVEKFYQFTRQFPSERNPREVGPWSIVAPPPRFKLLKKLNRKWNALIGAIQNKTRVYLGFEFSWLDGECFIGPHTDLPSKLISLMVYFPDDGCEGSEDMGTEFYQGKNSRETQKSWKAGMMKKNAMDQFFEKHEVFYKPKFTPNKLVGFIKTSDSWHGLQPLKLPAGTRRRSLNINYYLA